MTVHGRALLVDRIAGHGRPVAQAATAAGVSERRAYKWLARYRAGGEAALHDLRSTPHRSPYRTAEGTVDAIAALRRDRLSGPRIARHLRLPVSTVGAVLRRLGFGRLGALDERTEIVRYERPRAGRADPYRHQEARPHRRYLPPHHRRPDRTQAGARLGAPASRHRGLFAPCLSRAPVRGDRRSLCRLPRARGPMVCRQRRNRGLGHDRQSLRLYQQPRLPGRAERHRRTLHHHAAIPATNHGKAEGFFQTALREWLDANPYASNAAEAETIALRVQTEKAATFASNVLPVIETLRASSVRDLRGLAAALHNRAASGRCGVDGGTCRT